MFHADTTSLRDMQHLLRALDDDLQACNEQLRQAVLDIAYDSGKTMQRAAVRIRQHRQRCAELSEKAERLAAAIGRAIELIEDNERRLVRVVDQADVTSGGKAAAMGTLTGGLAGGPAMLSPVLGTTEGLLTRSVLGTLSKHYSYMQAHQRKVAELPELAELPVGATMAEVPPMTLFRLNRTAPYRTMQLAADDVTGESANLGQSLPTGVQFRHLNHLAGLCARSAVHTMPVYTTKATAQNVFIAVQQLSEDGAAQQPVANVAYPAWLVDLAKGDSEVN